jgi:site-specific DNA recombinase
MNSNTIPSVIRTVAIYQRVSTEDQKKEGYSLENQREANLAFVKMKFGPDVSVCEYADSESGATAERKDFIRLLDDCEKGKINALVIWRIDRFMRNVSVALGILSDLSKHKDFRVYSVTEGQMDMTDPNSKFISTIHLSIAEMERDRLIQRVMPGMKRGAQRGHYQGTRHVIYGARYNKPVKQLEWIPEEVKVIQIVFEKVAKGQSVHMVARYLHEQGYRNRKGEPIGKALLCRIVKREIYKDGFYRWNDQVSEKPILKPIVDAAVWEQANQVVTSNRWSPEAYDKRSLRDDSPYVLQGVLKCRHCGGNLIGHSSKEVRYYVCAKKANAPGACPGQYVKAEVVERMAHDILKEAVENEVMVEGLKLRVQKNISERNPQILASIRFAERELKELDAKHRKLLELHYSTAISLEQFKEENNRILEQQQTTQRSLDQLRSRQQHLVLQSSQTQKVFEALKDFNRIYDRLNFKARKNVFNWAFRFIHAKRLRKHKPVFKLDRFELVSPLDVLLNKEKWTNNQNTLEKQPKLEIVRPLDTLLSLTAAR